MESASGVVGSTLLPLARLAALFLQCHCHHYAEAPQNIGRLPFLLCIFKVPSYHQNNKATSPHAMPMDDLGYETAGASAAFQSSLTFLFMLLPLYSIEK